MGVSRAKFFASIAALVLAMLPVSRAGVIAAEPSEAAAEPASAKLPVPDEAAQQAALATIKQIFADDYAAAKKPDFAAALAQKLMTQAQSTTDDPAARFVLLREARDLATDLADCELLDQSITALDAGYTIDPLAMQLEAFQKLVPKSRPATANKVLAEKLFALVDRAIAARHFGVADQFSKLAVVTAGKTHDQALIKEAKTRSQAVDAVAAEHEAAEKARVALAKNPDDPDANLVLGKYECFVQDAWEEGLPHLAKGNDEVLQDLANRSLAAVKDPTILAGIGDKWWFASESAKAKDKPLLQKAAQYWYTKALPGLSGLEKVRIGQRLKAATPSRRPRDAVAAGGHFYKVFHEKISWDDAKAKCVEMGGYLVCITSQPEDAAVIQIVEAQIGPGQLGRDANKYFIGAFLEDGKWKWVSGEAFKYKPNDFPSDTGRPYLRHAGRNWLNTSNSSGLVIGFICEWDK